MGKYDFIIHNEEEYTKIKADLDEIFYQYLDEDYVHYSYAIKEACVNALDNYPDNVNMEIAINIHVFDDDIVTSVAANTKDFSPEAIREKYWQLANNHNCRDMDWGDYESSLPVAEQHRGIWYMLIACDYLYFSANGKKVTLIAKRPFKEEYLNKKIGSLVYRFLIEKNGVIY